ncbi:MAG: DUF3089 domain-containing protein [Syntrophales bacterium]|nr:DUF3089 domain-containing protein [Syntrophales bacterium]
MKERRICAALRFLIFFGIIAVSSPAQEIITDGGLSPAVRKKIEPSLKPRWPFDRYPAPPPPYYWSEKTWAALPAREDAADVAPPNSKYPEAQSNASADVFFIHPTGYSSPTSWNAPWNEKAASAATDGMMRYCTSAFNAAARVYAPRYRQMTIYCFFDQGTSGIRAADLAYSDVERSFNHYLKFWNQGRPLILAGHSQGSFHGLRLLQEKIIGTPLQDRLVAAYLIGFAVPMGIPGIEPSRSAMDTGTVIGWNTYTKDGVPDFFTRNAIIWLKGSYRKINGSPIVQINPLSWKLHGGFIPARKNPGALPGSESETTLLKLIPGIVGADASGKVLIINKPAILGFPGMGPDMPLLNADFGDYHNYDYQLFYETIRRNALDRVKAFMAKPN